MNTKIWNRILWKVKFILISILHLYLKNYWYINNVEYNLISWLQIQYLLLTAKIALTPKNRTFCFCGPCTKNEISNRFVFNVTFSWSFKNTLVKSLASWSGSSNWSLTESKRGEDGLMCPIGLHEPRL